MRIQSSRVRTIGAAGLSDARVIPALVNSMKAAVQVHKSDFIAAFLLL